MMQTEERNRLVQAHMYIASIVANRFSGRGVEKDDLYQVASLALLNAAERFDANKGVSFATFATGCVVGEVKHYFRDRARAVRIPRTQSERIVSLRDTRERLVQALSRSPTVVELAQAMGVSEEEVLETLEAEQGTFVSSWDDDPVETKAMPEAEREYALADALSVLNEQQKRLVYERFTMGRSQRETAEKLGVSQMTVSRMEKKTLQTLRAFLKKDETE